MSDPRTIRTKALNMEHSAEGRAGTSCSGQGNHKRERAGPRRTVSAATEQITSGPAHRQKASQSDAKHVRQECVNRGSAVAGRSHSAWLWPEGWGRDLGNAGRHGEPVGGRIPRRDAFSCHKDQSVATQIDGIVIMIAGRLLNRGSGCGMIAPRLMIAVAMASRNAIASVVMAMVMVVVAFMTGEMQTGEMDMRPTRMPRSLGMHLMRMRDRNSAEKQMSGHEQDKEQTHDSTSLSRPTCPGKLSCGAAANRRQRSQRPVGHVQHRGRLGQCRT